MSNTLRYDALLVRDLARELDATLVGARLDAAFLDRDSLRVTLRTRASRRGAHGPPSLLWQLHPLSGHLSAAPDGTAGGSVRLAAPSIIRGVHAPPDERVLVIDLESRDAAAGDAARIIIELATNQWNAVAIGNDGRITAILRERSARGLRAGAAYEAATRSARAGADTALSRDEWRALLGSIPTGERLGALQRSVAYTSAINAPFILGDADVVSDDAALMRAHERYLHLVWSGVVQPALLSIDGVLQPYPRPEPAEGLPMPSLLTAFAEAAARSEAAPAGDDAAEQALAAIARRLEGLDRRAARLGTERDGAAHEALELRRQGDLLLAQLHRVARGSVTVELDDFAGGSVTVEVDPQLSAADNATRLYDAARRRARAAERIPALLRSGERERERLEELAARIRAGTATADELLRVRQSARTQRRTDAPALPWREYRTSSGLEVRVGRGPRANDALTFRNSNPTDIWLHARDVAGAHVILRWSRTDENPPAHAIAEAAVLAALHSRARTSGTVAVDWTRRKYVRKPRKAPPGLVLPERVRTVFVEPDPAVEERMRPEL